MPWDHDAGGPRGHTVQAGEPVLEVGAHQRERAVEHEVARPCDPLLGTPPERVTGRVARADRGTLERDAAEVDGRARIEGDVDHGHREPIGAAGPRDDAGVRLADRRIVQHLRRASAADHHGPVERGVPKHVVGIGVGEDHQAHRAPASETLRLGSNRHRLLGRHHREGNHHGGLHGQGTVLLGAQVRLSTRPKVTASSPFTRNGWSAPIQRRATLEVRPSLVSAKGRCAPWSHS
jgi:hypothetical protein